MHRIRENCPATCAALPVHGCEDRADHVGSTGNVIAHPRKGGNERDACLTVRCTGHGASQQQHPHYNSHTLAFARPHTTRRSTPHSPLASGQMETSSDPVSASLGMEKNIRVACVHKLLYPCSPGSNPYHPRFYSPTPPARMVLMEKPRG
ncbi:hypothetical protein VNO80_35504 [Phaseolus coccineus]|uniref:Uncharacterized protein n=1 Tax=Phaseolus coccineus TaxID=3886 RepID=A0AAN9KQH1_PHACN